MLFLSMVWVRVQDVIVETLNQRVDRQRLNYKRVRELPFTEFITNVATEQVD